MSIIKNPLNSIPAPLFLDVYFSSLQSSLTAFKLLLNLTENNYKDLCQSKWAPVKERWASWKDSLSLARPVTPGQLCSLPVCGLGAAFAPELLTWSQRLRTLWMHLAWDKAGGKRSRFIFHSRHGRAANLGWVMWCKWWLWREWWGVRIKE